MFNDFSKDEVDAMEAGFADTLQEGGAAMAAYGRLQFETIDAKERSAIRQALLRYCEQDTLAMAIAVKAWQALLGEPVRNTVARP